MLACRWLLCAGSSPATQATHILQLYAGQQGTMDCAHHIRKLPLSTLLAAVLYLRQPQHILIAHKWYYGMVRMHRWSAEEARCCPVTRQARFGHAIGL